MNSSRRPLLDRSASILVWHARASHCFVHCLRPPTGMSCCAPTCTPENVLAAQREAWLVIDPKPYVGDPTYDALQHLLNCDRRLHADPHALARRIADLLGLDARTPAALALRSLRSGIAGLARSRRDRRASRTRRLPLSPACACGDGMIRRWTRHRRRREQRGAADFGWRSSGPLSSAPSAAPSCWRRAYSGTTETTRGVTATVPVPGHPGAVAAGPGALWVALNGDPRRPAVDRPLLRIDPATGAVARTCTYPVAGRLSSLAHIGGRLIASVRPVGDNGLGPRRLVALDWRSGEALALGASHVNDAVAREFDGPVDHVVRAGDALWALEVRARQVVAPGRFDARAVLRPAASLARPHARAGGRRRRRVPLGHGGRRGRRTAHRPGDQRDHAHPRRWVPGRDRRCQRKRLVHRSLRRRRRSSGPWHTEADRRSHPRRREADLARRRRRLLFVTDADSGTITRIDIHSGRRVGLPIRIGPAGQETVSRRPWRRPGSLCGRAVSRRTRSPASTSPAPLTAAIERGHADGHGQRARPTRVADGSVAGTVTSRLPAGSMTRARTPTTAA